MTTTKPKAAEDDGGNQMTMKEPRKRPHKELDNDDDKRREEKDDPSMTPSARRRQRRKRAKTSQAQASTNPEKPLAGMVLCISTLKDNVKSKKSSDSGDKNEKESTSFSYNDVCQSCRDLGADVIDLVCKRVKLLVCTEAAVRQATQRVRKALKRKKPLVSLDWLKQCKKQGRAVDFEKYRLDKKVEDALQNRNDRLSATAEDDSGLEFAPDAGWSEPKELG